VPRRLLDGQHLGVGQRALTQLALVPGRADHLALQHDHGADGHVAVPRRPLRLAEGEAHVVLISWEGPVHPSIMPCAAGRANLRGRVDPGLAR